MSTEIVGICPNCGEPVRRDQPAWGPKGVVHHDPCPAPEADHPERLISPDTQGPTAATEGGAG